MYENLDLVKLFNLKRETALQLKRMGLNESALTETLVVLAFAKDYYNTNAITYYEYAKITRLVNDFCDSIA
jgi:hypothetical protein